jgi:biopolymer transport protein ExbD
MSIFHVTLPKTAETTADVKEQPLQLGIDAQGAITLNKLPLADLAALETALKAELKELEIVHYMMGNVVGPKSRSHNRATLGN